LTTNGIHLMIVKVIILILRELFKNLVLVQIMFTISFILK